MSHTRIEIQYETANRILTPVTAGTLSSGIKKAKLTRATIAATAITPTFNNRFPVDILNNVDVTFSILLKVS